MGNLFSTPEPPPPIYDAPPAAYYARQVYQRPPPTVYNPPAVVGLRPPQTKSKKACHFHASGRGCWHGSSCRFSHDPAVIAREAREARLARDSGAVSHKDEMEMPAVNWTRELRGTWVQFADGAVVSKVSLPSDFSAVRLSNVPVGKSVVEMLGSADITVTRDQVRPMPSRAPASKNTYDAIVKVEDPGFAQRACTKLRTSQTNGVQAVQIPVPMPAGLNLNRIDCRRVQCSWLRPERTARLRFHDRDAANRVKKAYEAKTYRDVLGPPAGKAHIQADTAAAGGKREYTVILNGLAPKVDSADVILAAVGANDKPLDVVLGAPSYEAVPEMDTTMVMSMFTAIGPLEAWHKRDGTGGRYERAFATFADEAHAREAVSSLHNQPLPFGRLRLGVEPLFSASFRVSTRIYKAVKGRLDGVTGSKGKQQLQVWDRRFVRLAIMPPRGLFRMVKIEGKDRDAVVQAKDAASRILAGDVLRCNDVDLWADAFRNASGSEVARLTSFEPMYGVVLMRDVSRRQLRVFGPEAEYEHVAKAVRALMADVASSPSSAVHAIALGDDVFRWVITGGLHELQRRLGRGKAIIDVRPTGTRNLFILGSAADHDTALRLITNRQAASSMTAGVEGACPICLDEADRPITLKCGHVYCADCFGNFSAAGATSGAILCIGDAGRCQKPLPLVELHANLAEDVLEDVLAAAMDAYVRLHAQQLRNCPTPDCTHVYRIASAAAAAAAAGAGANDAVNVFTCPGCRATTCRLCHAAHPDRPCAVRLAAEAAEDAQMRTAKAALGLQDCPRCSVAIEKNDGCNHMTCYVCKVHFCWKCRAAFQTDSDCYQHMRMLHGNIY